MVQTAARILGIIYVIVGIIGFIPGISPHAPADAPPLTITGEYNYVLGLFAVNWLHSLVHLAVGLWGIAVASSFANSRMFFQSIAVIFAILFILGVIPATNTVFGLVPLFGADAWLHLGTVIIAAYFGWGATSASDATA